MRNKPLLDDPGVHEVNAYYEKTTHLVAWLDNFRTELLENLHHRQDHAYLQQALNHVTQAREHSEKLITFVQTEDVRNRTRLDAKLIADYDAQYEAVSVYAVSCACILSFAQAQECITSLFNNTETNLDPLEQVLVNLVNVLGHTPCLEVNSPTMSKWDLSSYSVH